MLCHASSFFISFFVVAVNKMVSAGSGAAAAKTLSTTLDKALFGSERLAVAHRETRDAFELSANRVYKQTVSQCTGDVVEEAAAQDDNSDPFATLAEAYPLDAHPSRSWSSDPTVSADPLFLLRWSWSRCCEDDRALHRFVSALKRHAGVGEPEAYTIIERVHVLVDGFTKGALQWCVLNGVGPLEEQPLVSSIQDVLAEQQQWQQKFAAVWRCALVHLRK